MRRLHDKGNVAPLTPMQTTYKPLSLLADTTDVNHPTAIPLTRPLLGVQHILVVYSLTVLLVVAWVLDLVPGAQLGEKLVKSTISKKTTRG